MQSKRFLGSSSYRGLRGSALFAGIVAVAASCGGSNQPAEYPNENGNSADSALANFSGRVAPSAATSEESKKGQVDEQQVQVVLARAAKNAHQCVDIASGKDQPHGDATVTVTFAGKGRSTKASIAPPFEGTQIGQCATRAFVDIIIPPFEGPDVERPYQVDLKQAAGKPEGAKKKGAKGDAE